MSCPPSAHLGSETGEGGGGRLRAPFLAQFRFLFVLLTSPLADLGWRPPGAERLSWNLHSTAEQSHLDNTETEQARTGELSRAKKLNHGRRTPFCVVRGRRNRAQTHDKPDFGPVAVSSWTTLWSLWLNPCVFRYSGNQEVCCCVPFPFQSSEWVVHHVEMVLLCHFCAASEVLPVQCHPRALRPCVAACCVAWGRLTKHGFWWKVRRHEIMCCNRFFPSDVSRSKKNKTVF